MSWYFLKVNKMVDELKVHDIFIKNPHELLNFVDNYVKIVLENGEVITGTVYTIDPVSQSTILVNKQSVGEVSLKIVFKHSVTSMEILNDVPEDQKNILNGVLFNSEKLPLPSENLKNDVKNWLLQNMIPTVENGDVLQIDSLEIYPPYGVEQCFCSNPIVLSRIQNLLKQMPNKNS